MFLFWSVLVWSYTLHVSAHHPPWSAENQTLAEYRETRGEVRHMEPDLFVEGYLLFSMNRALLTCNETQEDLIVGQPVRRFNKVYKEGVGLSATFSEIHSFTQANATQVYVADSQHGCVRSVNRLTNATSLVAGLCKTVQWSDEEKDGSLADATFSFISHITYHNDIIYVIEKLKMRVRKIDLRKGIVSVVVEKNDLKTFDLPESLIVDDNRELLYLSSYHGISKVILSSNQFLYITQEDRGYLDGQLLASSWSGASEMTFLTNNMLLVLDKFNGKLRIVDLNTLTVKTWCFNSKRSKKECRFDPYPTAMTLLSCNVYFGIRDVYKDTIQTITLPTWFCENGHIKHQDAGSADNNKKAASEKNNANPAKPKQQSESSLKLWRDEDNPLIPVFNTKYTVTHLDSDHFVDGNLLYCEYHALLTTNFRRSDIIVGQDHSASYPYQEGIGTNATFKSLNSFTQLNKTHVLAVDSGHSCIRSLDRTTNQTQLFAGECKKKDWTIKSTTDGPLLNATFMDIKGIIHFDGIVYMSENGIELTQIRKVDIHNDLVTTIETGHPSQKMAIDSVRRALYMTGWTRLMKMDLETDNVTTLSKNGIRGIEEGPIENTTWSGITSIQFIAKDSLIVADGQYFRIVNTTSMNVSIWCFTYYEAVENCTYRRAPRALLVKGHVLYAAMDDMILTLELPAWFEAFRISPDSATENPKKIPGAPMSLSYISHYVVNCQLLNANMVALKLAATFTKRYTATARQACESAFPGTCQVEAPQTICEKNVMTVSYKTNISIRRDQLNIAKAKSRELQNKTRDFMRLIVITAVPPATPAQADPDGLLLTPMLTP